MACASRMTVEDYCKKFQGTFVCLKQTCCKDLTVDCLACNEGVSIVAYCQTNDKVIGCTPEACV